MPFVKGHITSEDTRKKIGLSNKGHICSPETKLKMSIAHIGKKHSPEQNERQSAENKRRVALGIHNLWKGGITSKNLIIRMSLEYKLWRTAVFERDNFTCIWCGLKGRTKKDSNGNWIDIHADHIKPFAQYPELRFAIDNGRTLCVPCHKNTGTWGREKAKIIYEFKR